MRQTIEDWAGDEPRIDSFDHIPTSLSIPPQEGAGIAFFSTPLASVPAA